MKRIIFFLASMEIGGVEKSLLGVVNLYLQQNFEVHIALRIRCGGFLALIPEQVIIHDINGFDSYKQIAYQPLKQAVCHAFKHQQLSRSVWLAYCLIHQKLFKGSIALCKYAFRNVPNFSQQEFDIAVSFSGPDTFFDYYVAKCVNAKEKWGWIHFDVSRFNIDDTVTKFAYKNFSKINIVSKEAKEKFDIRFPTLASKSIVTPNLIDEQTITKLANADCELKSSTSHINILTVGRISPEKGQTLALKAIKHMIRHGFNRFIWWFVGDGSDVKTCLDYVTKNNLQTFVKFIPATANPYVYMKHCDLYVQPSLHEGFCLTLAEVKLFSRPLIVTSFTGAEEQLLQYHAFYKIVSATEYDIANAIIEFANSTEKKRVNIHKK